MYVRTTPLRRVICGMLLLWVCGSACTSDPAPLERGLQALQSFDTDCSDGCGIDLIPSGPRVYLLSPLEGDEFSLSEAEAGLTLSFTVTEKEQLGGWFEVRLDGEVLGTFSGPASLAMPPLASGLHVASVVWMAEGGRMATPGGVNSVRFQVRAECLNAEMCTDWTPCSLDQCVASSSGHPLCVYLKAVENCCLDVSECGTEHAGCLDADGDGFPECVECTTDAECADSSACSQDGCVAGRCVHQALGKCGTVEECDDANPCTLDVCTPETCICTNQAIPGCCYSDEQCSDGQPCTVDWCSDGVCRSSAPLEVQGVCCDSDAACPSLGPCYDVRCQPLQGGVGRCVWDVSPESPNCCFDDSECPSDPPQWVGRCIWSTPEQPSHCELAENALWCSAPEGAGIVINELMVDPLLVPDVAGEWVELFNASDLSRDVSGMRLTSPEGDSCELFPGETHLLAPGAYLVVGRVTDPLKNGGVSLDALCPLTLSLGNLGGTLFLTEPSGTELDRFDYAGGDSGRSQSRVSPYRAATGSNVGMALRPYNDLGNYGTPGKPNLDMGAEEKSSEVCDDGNACTLDICGGGIDQRLCANLLRDNCCLSDAACDDGNPCTRDVCSPSGQCIEEPIAGCCLADSECNDAWACTRDTCVNSKCRYQPADGASPCCRQASDCPAPLGCGATACLNGRCLTQIPPNCCKSALECEDGNPCTEDRCVDSECAHDWKPTCCRQTADCLDNGITSWCRPVWCIQGQCRLGPKAAGCCESLLDCDDGNPCTLDSCDPSQHLCVHEAVGVGCCLTDSDCPTAPAACQRYRCLSGTCQATQQPGCCVTDTECNDGNPCTNDGCVDGVCRNLKTPLCCRFSSDCPVRPHPCHHWECVDNGCIDVVEAPCGLMLNYLEQFGSQQQLGWFGFHTNSLPQGAQAADLEWRSDGLLGPDGHIKFTAKKGETVCVASPWFTLPKALAYTTLSYDWGVAAWQGLLVMSTWMRTEADTSAWLPLDASPFTATGMEWEENRRVAGPSSGELSLKVQIAWCAESSTAEGWVELDSVAFGIGRPPEFLPHSINLWAVPGLPMWQLAYLNDPNSLGKKGYSLMVQGDGAGWANFYDYRKTALPPEALAVRIGASPALGTYPGLHRFEVEAWQGVLHDTLVVSLEVGLVECITQAECPSTLPCSQAECVEGHCRWSPSAGPCCGNARLEAGEECDDGNLIADDGCDALCVAQDTDGDGVVDPWDLCPNLYEVFPGDLDGDGFGDACDPDRDGDLIADEVDNCLWRPNSHQADLDQDGQGDACDLDDDSDAVPDDADNCIREANPLQSDRDLDGLGDECDPDADNDGIPDADDDCPTVPDPYQSDLDLDGVGDVCDEDADGDGYDTYHDCDDTDAGLLPQWSIRSVPLLAFWTMTNHLGLYRDRPLVVARKHGEVSMVPALLEPEQALGAAGDVWELWGAGPHLALVRQKGGPLLALYPSAPHPVGLSDVPIDQMAVVRGTSAAWLGGQGEAREIYWLRQDVPERVTDNKVAESGLVMGADTLAWSAGGDIWLHDGLAVTRLIQDSVLDESPAFWPGGLAWVRRNAQAGKGNVVLYSEALHGITYVVDDVTEDRMLTGGGFGLAWARERVGGGETVFFLRADQAFQIPDSGAELIERIWVTDSFVAWVGKQEGRRTLWGFDGRDTRLLLDNLEGTAAIAVAPDQIAVNTALGVVVARWACVPLPDLDQDGERSPLHGGLDCDDTDPLVKPQAILQDITQGAVAVQSPPDMHQGKLVFTAFDGSDDELFYFDGRVLIRLTDDALPDSKARIHDGYVVWRKGIGPASEIWWFDGNALVAIPGSVGGDSPQVWGPFISWTRPSGSNSELLLWKSGQTSPLTVSSSPIYTDSISLRFGDLTWANKVADSQIFVRDLASGATREMGAVVASDRYPQPYGEFVAWLSNQGGWDVRMGDAQGHWPITDDLVDDLGLRHWNGVLAWVRNPVGGTPEVVVRYPDGHFLQLPEPGLQTDSLSLSNNTLAWTVVSGNQGDIRILWQGQLVQATSDSIPDRYPVADLDQVAWLHGTDVQLWKWVCGNDWDGDARSNQADSCPYHYNPNQTDLDEDGWGDACDPDDDNDFVGDFLDNCPDLGNPGQSDIDQDELGDACDPDADGDGHLALPYGGDDCNDLDAGIYPYWVPQVISGASVQNRSLSMDGETLAWVGKLGSDFELYAFRDNVTLRLTDNQVDDLWPSVGGNLVVWETSVGSDRDIALFQGTTATVLTNNTLEDRGPSTDGERVVWYAYDGQDYEIMFWDGMGTFQVTNNNKNDYHPSLAGSIVVWRGFDGADFEVYSYQNGQISNLSKNETDDGIPSTDGEKVAFSHFDGNDYEIARWEMGQTTVLTDSPRDDLDPVQKDGKTVWRRDDGHDFEIAVYEDHRSVQLTDDDLEKGPPDTDSGRVVWAARESGFDDWEIYTYKGGKIVRVTDNEEQDTGPAVFGDTIAWVCGDAICLAHGVCVP